MKKIFKLSLGIMNLYGMVNNINTIKYEMKEEINLLEDIKSEKKNPENLSSEKLNNVINYLNNLGNHTYTDHCPKIKIALEKIFKLEEKNKDLEESLNDLKEEFDSYKLEKYTNQNSYWKCQII